MTEHSCRVNFSCVGAINRDKCAIVRSIWVIALVALSGCATGLRDGVFNKDHVSYRIGVPPEADWRRVGFANNDLAWLHKTTGHVIAANATCENFGDPSLEVLTTHLLFGFTDREQKEEELEELDGREALHSKYDAKLDGVPIEIELVVLKKNGCVHDFSYVSPQGETGMAQATFDHLVHGFAQERSP